MDPRTPVEEPFTVQPITDHVGMIVGEAHMSSVTGDLRGVSLNNLAGQTAHKEHPLNMVATPQESIYPPHVMSIHNALT